MDLYRRSAKKDGASLTQATGGGGGGGGGMEA